MPFSVQDQFPGSGEPRPKGLCTYLTGWQRAVMKSGHYIGRSPSGIGLVSVRVAMDRRRPNQRCTSLLLLGKTQDASAGTTLRVAASTAWLREGCSGPGLIDEMR